jgi:beta-glucosidase
VESFNLTADASPQTQASLYAKSGPTISATVKNTGSVAGAEVAQLYLSFPQLGLVDFPPWQLRGFKKVMLKPGESKTVTFDLRRKDMSYWDIGRQAWVLVDGNIRARVATSSRAKGVEGSLQKNE